VRLRVKGSFERVSPDDVFRFYPWIRDIHRYVLGKSGWDLVYFECIGEAFVEIDPGKAVFDLEYQLDLGSGEHGYMLKVMVSDKSIGRVDIIDLVECKVSMNYHDLESILIIKIPDKTILRIIDPLWYTPKTTRFSFLTLFDIIDIVKYLISKGFTLSNESRDALSHIMDLVKSPRFRLEIEARIIDPDKAPSFERLFSELEEFFRRYGIIACISRKE